MSGINILPYFGRTLGRLCALRRIADTLLSDLEQDHALSCSRERLEGLTFGESFATDLSNETKDSGVLKRIGEETRGEAMGSYDTELSRYIERMKATEKFRREQGAGQN